jgi:hypothetical protein
MYFGRLLHLPGWNAISKFVPKYLAYQDRVEGLCNLCWILIQDI